VAERPALSICIPTFQRAPYLARCLEQLEAVHALPFSVEIVVSDNHSTDGTAEVLDDARARLPLRVVRQSENVGAERNVLSALRAARGRTAVYLGDDDALILDRIAMIVAMFDENPSLVCVQAPWISRDDLGGRDLGSFYQLDQPAAFTAADAWPCWQFLLKHQVFPEIAVYRTDALHRVLHLPRTLHWAFVWTFRLLGQGTVAFLPVPFYRHVVRAAEGMPERSQAGVEQATTHLDRYRGGLEWALAAALRSVVGVVPIERRQAAQAKLNAFIAQRAEVAARVAAGDRDFIGAIEHFSRSLAWDPAVHLDPIHAFEQGHTMLAGLQAVVETAASTAGVGRIVVVGLANVDTVVDLLGRVLGWSGPIEVADPAGAGAFDDALVLVTTPGEREAVIAAGAWPGRVLAFAEVADCFRVHNPLGAAQATGRQRAAS
jgi:hypothetical protein